MLLLFPHATMCSFLKMCMRVFQEMYKELQSFAIPKIVCILHFCGIVNLTMISVNVFMGKHMIKKIIPFDQKTR